MISTDVNALVEEAEGLVVKRLRERGVQIANQLDPRVPRIRASGDQLNVFGDPHPGPRIDRRVRPRSHQWIARHSGGRIATPASATIASIRVA